MKLSNNYKILLLVFIVLGVYYPAIFAKTAIVDDDKMLYQMGEMGSLTLKSLFLPGAGYYYRPILVLSFYWDKVLWALDPSFMHLENILLHLLNVLLVYFIAVRVYNRLHMNVLELPLLTALLFALHPINTEAVNWISGRTDLLAGSFVLMSTLVLLKGLMEKRQMYLVASAVLLLVGALSKEVAVFFFPAACLLLFYWRDDERPMRWQPKVQQLMVFSAPFALTSVFYVGLRMIAFQHRDSGIFRLLNGNHYDAFNSLRVLFKVFGFYVKKLVAPLPLNFITGNFSNQYVWLGIAALAGLVFLVSRRHILSALLLAVFCLIAPALLVALTSIAWTPVAERYLYIPAAFFVIAVVGYLNLAATKVGKQQLLMGGLVLLLLPATVFTAQRNVIWQDNVKLYQDSAGKSPKSNFAKNELALALMNSGRKAEADMVLDEAILQNIDPNYALLNLNQAQLRFNNGDYSAARSLLLQTFQDKSSAHKEVLKMLTLVDEARLRKSSDKAECIVLAREIIDTHRYLYPKTNDPAGLYRSGQLSLYVGEKQQAAEFFAEAYRLAPEDAFFKDAAKKLAEKCSKP